jgi:hypothetical protein
MSVDGGADDDDNDYDADGQNYSLLEQPVDGLIKS